MRMFGQRWRVGTDDFVFPGLLEILTRGIWLTILVMSLMMCRYHNNWSFDYCLTSDVLVRIYLFGVIVTNCAVILLVMVLVNRSAQGAIFDSQARCAVPHILAVKIVLLVPEIALNVLGTILWTTNSIQHDDGLYINTVVKTGVLFNWIVLGVCVYIVAMVLDPVDSLNHQDEIDTDTLSNCEDTRCWTRRFRWIFCCLISDKNSKEAFSKVAKLTSYMFRNTDIVLSDIVAGLILLGAKEKREPRGKRHDCTSVVTECFAEKPDWMCLKKARHYLRLATASYSWPYLLYRYCITGPFRMMSKLFCCACIRTKPTVIEGDNCCLCNFAAVRCMSKLNSKDILYASFVNHIFETPFFVTADHETSSVVVVIRGSISLQDVFTDLTADGEEFDAVEAPPGSYAQKGILSCAKYVNKELNDHNIIEKALDSFPNYDIVVTGHSLGAAVAVLLGFYMRSSYPNLKVYAFSTPAPLLSREAARKAEDFVFSICVGDDLFMNFTVDIVEDLRTDLVEELQLCRLPKYRVLLKGLSHALFGVPSGDAESAMTREPTRSKSSEQYLPVTTQNDGVSTDTRLADEIYTKKKFYIPGHILHITKKSKEQKEVKIDKKKCTYEMRWTAPEDHNRMIVSPRMMLDHLPESVSKAIDNLLGEK